MQLDTTIEQRLRELEQVNDEIELTRNGGQNMEDQNQMAQINLLADKLAK